MFLFWVSKKASEEGRGSCEMQQVYLIVHLKGVLHLHVYIILHSHQQLHLPPSSSLSCIYSTHENKSQLVI